ncbi:MAG TPA: hypothetical protein VNC84_07625 [Gammaproteobacteria bacterium]|nr:hypothetical protein [Gammaproteobacteria bacterium]
MDARHEPIEQEVFNQLISLINCYIRENVDDIVTHQFLREDFREMLSAIYHCADMFVDIDGLLSIKNFLSIDIVPLPVIGEFQVSSLLENKKEFEQAIDTIQSIIKQRKVFYRAGRDFYQQAESILANSQAIH